MGQRGDRGSDCAPALVKAINDPNTKEQFAALGAEPVGSTPRYRRARLSGSLACPVKLPSRNRFQLLS